MYYFNLDEGILTCQTTDANAVEKQRRGAFRMAGLTINDVDVLSAQSPNFSEVLNVRVTREGTLYKGALATDQRGFDALTAHTLTKAAEHLDAIRAGEAAVAPAEYREFRPCGYCDWRSVCLIDERLDAACVRRFPKMKADDVMERVTLKGDSGSLKNPSAKGD